MFFKHFKRKCGISVFFLFILFPYMLQSQVKDLIPIDSGTLKKFIQKESRKRILVINVWATWCEPCRKEFPYFVEAQKRFDSQKVKVVFLSADFSDQKTAAMEFLKSQSVEDAGFIKIGSDQEMIQILSPKWSGAIPATFIFKHGKLIYFHEGIISKKNLFILLSNLVKED